MKQQHKALRQASQLCCFGLQMQFVTVSMLALFAGSGTRAEPLEAAAQSVATGISTVLLWLADAICHCFLMLALLTHLSLDHRGEQERTEVGSKAPPAVAKSSPTAAKLGCAFSSPQRGAYS